MFRAFSNYVKGRTKFNSMHVSIECDLMLDRDLIMIGDREDARYFIPCTLIFTFSAMGVLR